MADAFDFLNETNYTLEEFVIEPITIKGRKRSWNLNIENELVNLEGIKKKFDFEINTHNFDLLTDNEPILFEKSQIQPFTIKGKP